MSRLRTERWMEEDCGEPSQAKADDATSPYLSHEKETKREREKTSNYESTKAGSRSVGVRIGQFTRRFE